MANDVYNICLSDVKKDLYRSINECDKRCLINTSTWLSEINHGLSEIIIEDDNFNIIENISTDIDKEEYDNYCLSKTYFLNREYDRAAYITRDCKSPVPKFLHFYSLYMAKEKKRLNNATDSSNLNDNNLRLQYLNDLLATLKDEYNHNNLDGYCLYLYGVVLKKLDLVKSAINVFLESIHAVPLLWCSWIELVPLISNKNELMKLNLPNHWMKHIFMGHAYVELYLNDEAIKKYGDLQANGFEKCLYFTSEMAIAYHNRRDIDKAIELFKSLQEIDPYRLDNLDILSNLLFVKELRTEMANLAQKATEIDKYRPETCVVVGNFYSIKCDHQKAIAYFQRALKLNPQYLSAWTLMGHEFMELKNTNAAIQSYRKAIDVNKHDYRAWYGLGQSYEILKLHFYSLYYFKTAHQLRPYDSRMLVALGETYEKLDKIDNAIKCFQKACNVGDIEGISLYKLGRLYEKRKDMKNAIKSYLQYCKSKKSKAEKLNLYHAYMTLAIYYDNIGNLNEASHFARKCLESDEKKAEAKALLKSIESRKLIIKLPLPRLPRKDDNDCDTDEIYMDDSDMIIENSNDDDQSSTDEKTKNGTEDEEQTTNNDQTDTSSISID